MALPVVDIVTLLPIADNFLIQTLALHTRIIIKEGNGDCFVFIETLDDGA